MAGPRLELTWWQWPWAVTTTTSCNPDSCSVWWGSGGSVGQAGFPGILFHSNNLQVCPCHTPNFNLAVTDDLLLKCLVIKENPCWFINDPHYTLTGKVSWVTNNFLPQTLWPRIGFPCRVHLIRTHLLMNYMDLGLDRPFPRVFPDPQAPIKFVTAQGFSNFLSQDPIIRKNTFISLMWVIGRDIYQIRCLNEETI